MNLRDVEFLARTLIHQHVPTYRFEWMRAKKIYGHCDYANKTIRLSSILMSLVSDTEVYETIMHEIAHALQPKAKHGLAWKLQMQKFGLPANRCGTNIADLDSEALYTWVGICPAGHKTGKWMRKPRAVRSCGKCSRTYNPAYRLTYTAA
jgi:predicted SprT family Zn-dependent metalloprotease